MTKKMWLAIVFYFASLSFVFSTAWVGGRKNLQKKYMFGFQFELYDPNNRNVCIREGHNYRVEGWYSGHKNSELEMWVERFEGAPSGNPRHKWRARKVYGQFFDAEAYEERMFGEKDAR